MALNEAMQEAMTTPNAASEADLEELSRRHEQREAMQAVRTYLHHIDGLLELEPKMAAALLPKAHRKALDYAKLVGDE